jgi:signal transduction histidine kinase
MSNCKLHDLNDILKSALIFMEHRIKTEDISLRKKFVLNLPRIQVNADDIFLVIVNLLGNAFDSMPKGGKLLIESQCCKEHDACVQFSISDTGCGIGKNEMGKIFDPFFTINADGARNGLGLTISKTIIENHNGNIKVASSLGKGTTFTVCFPAGTKNNAELNMSGKNSGTNNYDIIN